tara:strand:+ start:180 stop:449 length:270 start_codon:yes stop_codon:yes gene_type:complete
LNKAGLANGFAIFTDDAFFQRDCLSLFIFQYKNIHGTTFYATATTVTVDQIDVNLKHIHPFHLTRIASDISEAVVKPAVIDTAGFTTAS